VHDAPELGVLSHLTGKLEVKNGESLIPLTLVKDELIFISFK
jgi:hypothetical protein